MTWTYDDFGRTTTVRSPREQTGPPTIAMEFFHDAPTPSAITRHFDEQHPSDTIDTVTFIDALTRVIQTKKDLEKDSGASFDGTVGMTVSGRIVFDAMGRVVKQGQPVFSTAPAAQFVNVPLQNPVLFEYDVLGRTTKVTAPDNSVSTTSYGLAPFDGLTMFEAVATDAEAKVRRTFSDVTDRTVGVVERNTIGGTLKTLTTRYAYNPLSEITAVTDAKGNVTASEYDTLGRRTAIDSPDMGRTEYRFDLSGNLGAKETANLRALGRVIRYLYTFNRLDKIDYPSVPPNESRDVLYAYGAPGALFGRAGRIVTVQDESGIEERFYGKLGETVKTVKTFVSRKGPQTPVGANGKTYVTEYKFDSFGRMTQMTYPDGEVLSYGYDKGGLLDTASGVKEGNPYSYLDHQGYDEFEARVRTAFGNGAVSKYDYDAKMRRLDTLDTKAAEGQIQNLRYSYDNVGNVTRLRNVIGVGAPPLKAGPTDQLFGYDDLHQLVSAAGEYRFEPSKRNVYALSMAYDEIGNIRRKTQTNDVIQPSSAAIPQRKTTYDWVYRYNSSRPHAATNVGPEFPVADDESRTFSFDLNGNQTGWTHDRNGTRRTIVWNEEDRIRSVSDNGRKTEFLYDASGERTHKVGQFGETIYVNAFFTIRNDAVMTKNIFGGETRVCTKLGRPAFPAEPGHGTKTKGVGPGTVTLCHKLGKAANEEGRTITVNYHAATMHLAHGDTVGPCGGTGGSLPPTEEFRFFYHPDHLGSSNYITDKDGKVFEHVEYFPFGETWVQESSNTQWTPYLFTSKELDQETGLYYYGARYYDPRVSQWVSGDPVLAKYLPSNNKNQDKYALAGEGGVFNPINLHLYAYSHQKPVTYQDPDGRWSSKNIRFPIINPMGFTARIIVAQDVHQMAIRKVLGNQVTTDQSRILQERQVIMDKYQAPAVQYTHAMVDSRAGLAKTDQIQEAETFVKGRLIIAMSEKQRGLNDSAFQALGDAIHTVQDATSPAHREFQDWNGQGITGQAAHVGQELLYPQKGSREQRELEGATQWIFDIFTGKVPMPEQFFDPGTGHLLLPQPYQNQNQQKAPKEHNE